MRNPVLALIWECWRLSRRWYLWVLPLAFVIDLMLLSRGDRMAANRPPGFDADTLVYALLAPGVFMLNFTLAIFATMLAMSIGSRAGFPLNFEFRLPVKSSVLVAVPMLTLATLCASLYVVPMLVCRLLYGVPFPLLPAAMLIGSLVFILLACGWFTTSSTARSFSMIFGMVAAMQLQWALAPFNMNPARGESGQPPAINADFVARLVELTPGDYALLAGICLVLYALAAASVHKQRCGEALALQLPGLGSAQPRAHQSSLSLASLLERAPDLFALQCPVTSPWRAELWLELKRQVMPILLISMLLALCVPLLFLFGLMPTHRTLGGADYLFPVIVFFAGVGIAVFNRRQASAGYMSAFEGTRGMSTLQLAAIQVLSVAGGTLLGLVIVCISVYLSAPLLATPGNLALRLRELFSTPSELGGLYLLTAAVTQLVNFVSAIMLLACVHTWSVVWGRWIPYGAGAIAIYCFTFAVNIQAGSATLDDIKEHMWAFAAVIFLLTLVVFGRVLYLKILSLRTSAVALLCWALFLACSLYSLARQDIVLTRQTPELQVFNAALLVAPLLIFVLLLWSYDRLRHR